MDTVLVDQAFSSNERIISFCLCLSMEDKLINQTAIDRIGQGLFIPIANHEINLLIKQLLNSVTYLVP